MIELVSVREPHGFTEDQAEGLVGRAVIKKITTAENPAVPIGQAGKVIAAEPSDLNAGFAVSVDWGDGEIWVYDDWADFSADVDINSD